MKKKFEGCINSEIGASFIEIILVVMIISFVVLLIGSIPNAIALMTKSQHLSLAREIASKQVEDKRSTSYANLVNGTNSIDDSRMVSLPKGSGTVTVGDCDPSICTNGEHIKQLTVTITWQDIQQAQTINIKTLIGEGGLDK